MSSMLAASELFTQKDATLLFVSLALLLGAARVMGEIARRYGQPAVLGEILAGILLGQTFLGWVNPDLFALLFPTEGPTAVALQGFIIIAVTLLLLVAGIEVDLSSVWRQGKAALSVSLSGIVFPFAIGCGAALLAPGLIGKDPDAETLPFALFVGIAMSITALPVIAKVLLDLKIFHSDIGVLIMSAAMINDLVGWLGFAMVLAMVGSNDTNVGYTIVQTLVFVALMLTLGRMLFHRIMPFVQAHTAWPGGVIGVVLVIGLFCGAITEYIGIHAIFGAFIAGVAMGDSNHLRERTRDTIHQFVMSIFAPVFFASIGLHVNFIAAFNPVTVVFVLVIALIGKVLGCYLGASWAGIARNESWAIGFGMSARGAMEIVLAQLALHFKLINEELFVAIVVMALATSLISGPAMQRALGRRRVRSLGEMLTDKQFIPAMRAANVRDAITEMSTAAAEVTDVPLLTIVEAVWQREQIMHTGLGDGIAVPHARIAELKKSIVVIGRSERGIDFDAADGRPAQIVCLLLTPYQDHGTQVELLRSVAATFGQPDARQQAMAARTYTEFLAAIRLAAEEQVGHPP